MHFEDYLISTVLILTIFRQIKGKPLTSFGLLWPIGLVLYAGIASIHGVPLRGNDLSLILSCAALGIILGLSCGMYTKVYERKQVIIARATGLAIVLWIIGMSGRLLFGLYAEHGGGQRLLTFSAQHHLDITVWAPALILMSLLEVLSRSIPLYIKKLRLNSTAATA